MVAQHAMPDLRRIPVARVLIPFLAGILLGSRIAVQASPLLMGMLVLAAWICLLTGFISLRRRTTAQSWFTGLWVFILCLSTGVGKGVLSQPSDPGLPVEEWTVIRGVVKETPRAAGSLYRCELSLELFFASGSLYSCETLLQVYFYQGIDSVLPEAGETWQWMGKLTPIRNSGNPGSPDFESLMHRKDCWYRFYASPLELPRHSVRILEASLPVNHASHIGTILFENWGKGDEELALIRAVCLGDRSFLTTDMQYNYGAAGGMHLLAVSGLHVGLIWWVLQGFTRWMLRMAGSEIYRTLLVLVLLWFYASVTGFSSSVCRSVTMFSFFSLGRMFGQRTQMLNGILVSALLLLLIQPARLMELGFQLSYTAVLGIVVFFPVFQKLMKTRNRIIRWLWSAAMVSLSAQLLSAPLVIFHFHQLPAYSVITSLIAIPLLSILLALFTTSAPFILSGILVNTFHEFLSFLARMMNLVMETIAALPGALVEGLHLSLPMLVLWMLFLALLMCYVLSRSKIPACLAAVQISLILLYSAWSLVDRRGSAELVLCHFHGGSQVILRQGEQVDVFSWPGDSTTREYMERCRSEVWSDRTYEVRLYEPGSGGKISGSPAVCRELARGVWLLGNDRMEVWVMRGPANDARVTRLLLDPGDLDFPLPGCILLSGEPSGSFQDCCTDWSSTDLIMDGSNRSWFRNRMHEIRSGIHDTQSQGAYIKRW